MIDPNIFQRGISPDIRMARDGTSIGFNQQPLIKKQSSVHYSDQNFSIVTEAIKQKKKNWARREMLESYNEYHSGYDILNVAQSVQPASVDGKYGARKDS